MCNDAFSLTVAFDQLNDTMDLRTFDGAILVIKLANDVTYQRMKRLANLVFIMHYKL